MKRRHLLGAVTSTIGAPLALGTGAFSSTRAERSVKAEVVDDSEAYLQIDAEATGIAGRSSEVDVGKRGDVAAFRIPGPEDDLVGGTDPGGVGVNSEYWFGNMAVIRNQGTQQISVYSEYSGSLEQVAIFDTTDQSTLLTSKSSGRKLSPGESFTMGIYLKIGDQSVGEYDEKIGIVGEMTGSSS